MTEGPFYPSARWRAEGPFAGDWDADLTRVQRAGRVRVAEGEHLALALQLRDGGTPAEVDEGFRGYGQARTAAGGGVAFRTIRPAPYSGRTPHIHVKLRHASFGEISSQLFVEGDAGNAGDLLWRRLDAAERHALALQPQPATEAGLRWQARHTLVLPA